MTVGSGESGDESPDNESKSRSPSPSTVAIEKVIVPNSQQRIRCFLDVTLGGLPAGRICLELYPDITPKTCENFRALCTGEKGLGKTTGKHLHFKGVIFHRVVKDFMIQAGDFSAGNGTGGESIYGGTFDDENFIMKHDKPFLLSMANRGKGTNGAQFFITTQPAPHLDDVHVVFGHVVSGHDLVRQLEQLPVDRNSRPLQDAVISNCGELVRQIKVKKEKKKKKVRVSESDKSESGSETEKKKSRTDKKKKNKKKKSKDAEAESKIAASQSEQEEGEIDDTVGDDEMQHPMVTLTKIDPNEIPEVSNKYLMRGGNKRDDADGNENEIKEEKPRIKHRGGDDGDDDDAEQDRGRSRRDIDRNGRDAKNTFGWSKKRVPLSRSGRVIKGRGVFRYRTPSRSRSRSKSQTPPHWKHAQKRTIKLSDLEKAEEENRVRELEIKRRESERKKRHEELARNSKKSFFELNQENNYNTNKLEVNKIGTETAVAISSSSNNFDEKEEGELDATTGNDSTVTDAAVAATDVSRNDGGNENKKLKTDLGVDMNALDYEDLGSDREENDDAVTEQKTAISKAESIALAFGVEMKTDKDILDSTRSKTVDNKKNSSVANRNNRSDRPDTRDRYKRRRSSSRDRSSRNYYAGRGGNSSSSQRVRRRDDRSRSRGRDLSRHRGNSSHRRSSRDRRVDRRRSISPATRRRKSRSRHRSRTHSPPPNRRGSSRGGGGRRHSRSPSSRHRRSRSRSRRRSRSRSNAKRNEHESTEKGVRGNRDDTKQSSTTAGGVEKPSTTPSTDEKEKMLKRSVALQLLKDHMRKEIEEQEKRQLEKLKQKEREDAERAENALEIARLEEIKRDTLLKLKAQEDIKQLVAVKKVLEVVVSSVTGGAKPKSSSSHGNSSQKKSKRSRSSSSSSSSSSASSSSSSSASHKRSSQKQTHNRSSDRRKRSGRRRSSD